LFGGGQRGDGLKEPAGAGDVIGALGPPIGLESRGIARPRFSRPEAAFALLVLALIASAILLAYWGRGQTLHADEFDYAIRLSTQSLGHAMLYPPSNGYLIAAPLPVYKALFEVFGIGDYAAQRAAAIALLLIGAVLFYVLARRRVGDFAALAPTVLLLFFGYGWEVILTADRIPGSMALAAGLGMFIALSRMNFVGDLVGAALLTLSLASHPGGIAFVAGAAVLVLTRPPPWRWRSAWVFLLPAALYGAWWLFLRPEGSQDTTSRLSDLASFAGQSWAELTASISGLAGVLDGPAYHHGLGWAAGALLFALVVAGVATSWRRLPPMFWAAAATLLALFITTAVTRGNVFLVAFRPADAPRYLYPEAFLLLLMLVELAGAVRLPSWATVVAAGVLALGLVANVNQLVDAGAEGRRAAEGVRAAYGAVEISSRPVPPNYNPLGFFYPTADQYLDVTDHFGSLGYSPAEIRARSPRARMVADRVLLRTEGIQPRIEASPGPRAALPPQVASPLQGTVTDDRGCLRLQPRPEAGSFAPQPSVLPPPITASASPPALAEITLTPGSGIQIGAKRLGEVAMRAGRFVDLPLNPIQMPATGRFASIAVPADGAALPWRLVVYSHEPVSLCGG
jgi:hypothetical protein